MEDYRQIARLEQEEMRFNYAMEHALPYYEHIISRNLSDEVTANIISIWVGHVHYGFEILYSTTTDSFYKGASLRFSDLSSAINCLNLLNYDKTLLINLEEMGCPF